MGREVRMVKKGWQHPTTPSGQYVPLYEGPYSEAVSEWDEENALWSKGFRKGYGKEELIALDEEDGTYVDWAGERPVPERYMPEWGDFEKTQYMMYETTSEGTPISPAFDTPEELAKWLADTGASSFGPYTATYEEWLSCVKKNSAPSMVIYNGVMKSGVEAMAELLDDE